MSDFLICFHVRANAGYAIEPLEVAFFEAATQIVGNGKQIHLGYRNFDMGEPRWLNGRTDNLIKIGYKDMSKSQLDDLTIYIKKNNIKFVLAFDLPVGANVVHAFRRGGVTKIFSYCGAPMSSINHGIKLLLKRIQVLCTRSKPDHFIFESRGMQETATHGRGVNINTTSVVHLGIDTDVYSSHGNQSTVYKEFGIPEDRKIIFYAGHMEKRKGVDVIVKAAATLVNIRNRKDLHFLICGNRVKEEIIFDHHYLNTPARDYITFGGYRNDIPELMSGCYAGVIASTGWDSFPRSSLEMAAAGLPLLVSDLAGLNETIEDARTGLLFTPSDHIDLADKLEFLANNTEIRNKYSINGKDRVKNNFTLEIQQKNLVKTIRNVIDN